jgi:uncharacterized protein YacL
MLALNVLRGLFVLLMAAAGYWFVTVDPEGLGRFEGSKWMALAVSLSLGVLMVVLDIVSGRRKLAVFGGVTFGLVVGLVVSYAMSFAVTLVVDNVLLADGSSTSRTAVSAFLNLLVGTACCYFAISFVLQTKDDFRFILPYVEFRRDARGSRPIIVDTSALLDGRLVGVIQSGFLPGRLVVPRSVVGELQSLADGKNRGKRQRARKALDRLSHDRRDPAVELDLFDDRVAKFPFGPKREVEVDERVVQLTRELDGRLLTVDHNLEKVANVQGVPVLSLNALSAATRPEAVPGETLRLPLERRGSSVGQAVGHLTDGTMVVVESAAAKVGEEVEAVVTNVTQTAAGRMIFADLREETPNAPADESPPPPSGTRRVRRKVRPATAGTL